MKLKISAPSFLKNHYLVVRSDGVHYCESMGLSSVRRFRFTDIFCVLLGADHTLSFQVGQEVFSIPTNPRSAKHQTVIATLVQEIQRAAAGRGSNG